VVAVSSPQVAEMVKLLENTFRSVNIGLVNELALMCARLKIDVWEVIRAAATKPFGFMPFYPGPGLGGHCIPIDPFYLSWKARARRAHRVHRPARAEHRVRRRHAQERAVPRERGEALRLRGHRHRAPRVRLRLAPRLVQGDRGHAQRSRGQALRQDRPALAADV